MVQHTHDGGRCRLCEMVRASILDDMAADEARTMLVEIHRVLWRPKDPGAEWTPTTLDQIVDVFVRHGA